MAILVAPPYRSVAMEDPMNPELLFHDPSAPALPTGLDPAAGGLQEPDVIQAAQTSACVLFTGIPNAKNCTADPHLIGGAGSLRVACGPASETILERQLFDLFVRGRGCGG